MKAGKVRKGTEKAGTKQEEGMVKVVMTPVLIPYTQDSELRRRLQEADNMLGEATNSKDCLPCQGRQRMAGEMEERPLSTPGCNPLPRPSKNEVQAIPK